MPSVQILHRSRSIESDFIIRIPGVTEEQFDAISTEDTPYELMDDVLIVHSPASFDHEELGMWVGVLMTGFVTERDLGHVVGSRAALRLRTGRKVEPDVMYLSKAREPAIGEMQTEGTADLVVEVMSASTRAYDLGDKRSAYRDARTPEIWFVDRKRKTVIVDTRHGRGYRSRAVSRGVLPSSALPGFWIRAEWLWQRPLPRPLECLRQILAGPPPKA